MADGKYITTSYDRSVVVLDKNALKLVSRVQDAHSDLINHVAVNASNFNLFSTAGNDGQVSLWDFRNFDNSSQPCIYDDVFLKPTCVQFVPGVEHQLLVGNQTGEILLFDIRKPKDCIAKNAKMEHSITKMKFSCHDRNIFGVCSESTSLRLFSIDEKLPAAAIEVKYEDHRHEDFVRDVAWPTKSSKKFLSCGWDHKVF